MGYVIFGILLLIFIIVPRPEEIARRRMYQQQFRLQQAIRERERAIEELHIQKLRRQAGLEPYDARYHNECPLFVIANHFGYADEWEMAEAMGFEDPNQIYH